MAPRYQIVGLGELLWDVFADGERLGGAPANVTYHAAALGDAGVLATRVGNDERGERALRLLSERGVDTSCIQADEDRPTGTARVDFCGGEPRFVIDHSAAWTAPVWDSRWEALFRDADALCFGSLFCAQPAGRDILERAVAALSESALRVLDLNLRAPFDSQEVIEAALDCANVVKLNHTEATCLAERFGYEDPARGLLESRDLMAVAITRGEQGSILRTRDEYVSHDGIPAIEGGDSVGAGDAFTAVLTHHLLREHGAKRTNDAANLYAAHVTSCRGAMPCLPSSLLRRVVEC